MAKQELFRGSVKWFAEEKGYGFISIPGRANDVFCHFSGISGTGRKNLVKGQTVEFYLEESKVRPGQIVASQVIVVDD